MTPRTLIAAIGTTAIAFAAVIVSLSGTVAASHDEPETATRTVQIETYAARDTAWNGACEFAL